MHLHRRSAASPTGQPTVSRGSVPASRARRTSRETSRWNSTASTAIPTGIHPRGFPTTSPATPASPMAIAVP
jgi:hypothetical protein